MKNDEEYFLNQAYEEQEYIRRFEDIMSVAYSLAYNEEMQFRHAVDSDPEGDGYNLYAAENMLSSEDYFNIKVNDRQYKIADLIHADFMAEGTVYPFFSASSKKCPAYELLQES